jgi:hypothetical protein
MNHSKPYRPTRPIEQHSVFDQSPSEHIQLASDDEDEREAKTLTERLLIRDRWHGTLIELALFAEGVLTVCETRRGKLGQQRQVDLRYLDPAPLVERHIATKTLYVALGCAGAAAMGPLAALLPALAEWSLPWMLASASASAAAFTLALYRTRKDFLFLTAHGRAPVVKLRARFGCLGRCRHAVARLGVAIRAANDTLLGDKAARLKAEMREHYRLQQSGVISGDDCMQSTGRILAHYD